jgi:hypothetical protein
MSEQKFAEFRERAEFVVTPADPDALLKRGRALRRRRQLAPVVAVAAITAVGFGIFASGGDDVRNEQPADTPSETPSETPSTSSPRFIGDEPTEPGTWALDYIRDGEPDATLEVFGDGWVGHDGIYKSEAESAVTVTLGLYSDTIIDRCDTSRHAESLSGAVQQLSRIPGTVTIAPSRETAMGVTGTTHLQLSIPVDVECTNGATPAIANLNAIREGPTDPTVTVDVWLFEHDGRLLLLTKGVRGNPSEATIKELNQTLDSLRLE